jgi:hypothetical protein
LICKSKKRSHWFTAVSHLYKLRCTKWPYGTEAFFEKATGVQRWIAVLRRVKTANSRLSGVMVRGEGHEYPKITDKTKTVKTV